MSTKKKLKPATPVDALTALQQKFSRLKDLRSRIACVKPLYSQYDELLQELLPLFITKNESGDFSVKRQIVLGNRTYRLTPFFYNEKKGQVSAKVWKSSAFQTFAIE
jgi:hypothetical protein